ncbi:uncharacterized protein LOC125777753 [Bactrocera dorsalis]|uniref:Uncharacterized protein LOC125777753 n=1 Tax=Bactrocera dorsalis TaxID=27457 RepID=A0ABM3JIX0_BACDO|nr:uncharacterized protein LOC125777753 [Bactrocera dorsalis]
MSSTFEFEKEKPQNLTLVKNFFKFLILQFLHLCQKMFPTKLFSNDSLPSLQGSLFSLNSVYSNTFGPAGTRMELYPRRRHTEFYYDPQPMEEYQSRVCEHPQDKLQHKAHGSKFDLEPINEESPKLRINPPKNSDMRMFRNSYFS